jgi:hypothetical protein
MFVNGGLASLALGCPSDFGGFCRPHASHRLETHLLFGLWKMGGMAALNVQ